MHGRCAQPGRERQGKMKPDRDLLQYSLYATATGLMIYLGITLINHIGVLWPLLAAGLDTLEQLLTPLLGALVIVYLQRPGVLAGMTAIFMAFAGQFAFFTYIRPVYMTMAGFDVDGLTLVLLSFGIASFVGTSLSSQFLKRSLKVALAGAPLVLAASAAVLVLWGSDKWVASAIAIIWGFAFALVPVGWSTWITRSLADQAEKAGSIQVAVIQLANTCGAAVGGVALDHLGLLSPLVLSGILMLFTGLLVATKVKVNPPA